tara:strand:+ start:669 stop:1034 length:366 start_codon:yes stop_codon:yes gene_type:complete
MSKFERNAVNFELFKLIQSSKLNYKIINIIKDNYKNSSKNILYSKNPRSEILKYLEYLSLKNYFHMIFSTQKSKQNNSLYLRKKINGKGLLLRNYYGDSEEDFLTAMSLSMKFFKVENHIC